MNTQVKVFLITLGLSLFLANPVLKLTAPCVHAEWTNKFWSWLDRAAYTRDLSLMYLNGSCVAQDVEKGKPLLVKAAQGDDAEAQALLGAMKLAGRYFDKDREEGLAWLRRARDNGSDNAAEALKAFETK